MGNTQSEPSVVENMEPPFQHYEQRTQKDDALESLLNVDHTEGQNTTGTELQTFRKDPDQQVDSHVINMEASSEPSEKEIIGVAPKEAEQAIEKDEVPADLRNIENSTKQLPLEKGAIVDNHVAVVDEEQEECIQQFLDDVSNRVQNSEPNAVFLVDGLRNSDALSLLTQAIEMLPDASKPFIVIDVEKAEISKRKETLEKKTDDENENVKNNGKKKRKGATKAKSEVLPLPEGAKQHKGIKWRLEIQRRLVAKYKCVSLRIIIGLNKDIIVSICNDDYFDEDTPVLLINDGSEASNSLHALQDTLKAEHKEMKTYQKAFKRACKDYDVSDRDLDKMILKLKQYSLKIHGSKLPKKNKIRELTTNVSIAICRGMMPGITFLMDSSQEVAKSLRTGERYSGNSTIIYFPNMFKQHTTELNLELFRQYTDDFKFLESKIRSNRQKVLAYTEESGASEYYNIVKDCVSEDNIKKYLVFFSTIHDDELHINHSPVLKFRHELNRDRHETAKEILRRCPMDIYSYIYFNISNHWKNSSWVKLNKVIEHFKILDGSSQADASCVRHLLSKCIDHGSQDIKKETADIGRRVNKAIYKLSNGMVADLFTDDGRPNLEVVNPIQALMVNRLFCMQFDFVKALWFYDKKNSLTNGILLWVLIEGIHNEHVFTKKDSSDIFHDFKKYLDKTTITLLEIAQRSYQDAFGNPILSKSPIFKNRRLIDIAGELKYESFFIQTIARRVVAHEWSTKPFQSAQEKLPKGKENSQADHEQSSLVEGNPHSRCENSPFVKFLEKLRPRPRNKLYIHMFMYIITYISVAYYTIRGKSKDSYIMRWITFTFLTSLALDEARQAFGSKGLVSLCLRRWWSDAWNVLDFVSMLFYFVAISLDFAGFPVARFLLAIFSFIWCLKFYQFLRAFKSVGIYIIIVQKMLPHMGNFSLVAFVALIGYGVFMTSILFPSHKFESWSTLLMMLIRPYLLLFAETGIEQFQLSSTTTLFSTPKIPAIYEIATVIGMCAFLMFGSILLMNLLIAVFSGVYEDVKEKSERLWVINDFELLKEFEKKPAVPIPFSIPVNIYRIVKRFLLSGKKAVRSDEERVKMERKQEKLLKDFIERKGVKQDKFEMLRCKVVQEVKKLLQDFTEKLNLGLADVTEKQE